MTTVGSGDCFLAGYVAARYEGASPRECLAFGVACGAESTQHFGAGTLNRREVERLLPGVQIASSARRPRSPKLALSEVEIQRAALVPHDRPSGRGVDGRRVRPAADRRPAAVAGVDGRDALPRRRQPRRLLRVFHGAARRRRGRLPRRRRARADRLPGTAPGAGRDRGRDRRRPPRLRGRSGRARLAGRALPRRRLRARRGRPRALRLRRHRHAAAPPARPRARAGGDRARCSTGRSWSTTR